MKKFLLGFSVILLLVSSPFLLPAYSQESFIPSWVKTTAGWWSDSQVSDKEFAKSLEFLIQNNIIKIPNTLPNDSDKSDQIPSWLKKNAGWWSQGLLSDIEFVKGIQHLVSNGIIRISPTTESSLCTGSALCVTAKVQRIVDGDTIYIEGYKVRLSLTDTPEKDEPGFFEATNFTKKLCPVGSIVTVDQDDRQSYDVYNRLLGKMYCNDKILNSELLLYGHATILTQYCSTSEFAEEKWAKQFGCATNYQNISLPQYQESSKSTITPKESQCDPSYPDFCIPPPPPDLDCKDIPQKRFTVLQPDPHRFDGDKDGIGCES